MEKRKTTFISVVLYPLSIVYGSIIVLRNKLFDWGILPEKEFDIPLISVGNITVGGTGKTPHIEYLINLLKDEFNIATLSRGYKRKTSHFITADNSSSVSEIGDEPKQLKQKYPEITVAVEKRRVKGVHQLMNQFEELDVILLDDAFQHRFIKPGKNILLIDFNRFITDDQLIPSGRLREPASGKVRADIILVTKSPAKLKPIEMRNLVMKIELDLHQHLFFTTIDYGDLLPVFKTEKEKQPKELQKLKAPILIVAGIAQPRAIRKYARQISTDIHEIYFGDHHQYAQKDMETIKNKYLSLNNPDAILLTTEKDAMRLQDLDVEDELKKVLYYVTIHVRFLHNDTEEFNNLIFSYVKSNKRNRILHKRQD